MGSGNKKLDAVAEMLERTGDDPLRLDIVRRAQAFKRSWVQLAEGLNTLQQSRAYEGWGYGDLHEYCSKELSIKAVTVDKLLLSFGTLSRHAPEVLRRDGVARPIPTVEAVDYFSRALGQEPGRSETRRLDAPRKVLDELRSAVFDENHSVSELRQRFNPVLYPKPEGAEEHALLRRTRDAARRLAQLVREVEGLSEARVARVDAILGALVRDLDKRLEEKPAVAMKKSAAKKSANRQNRKGARTR